MDKIYDKNERVQKNAIRFLGSTKYEDAVEPLMKMLSKKKYYDLRRSIIGALGSIGDKTATPEIIKFIDDEDELCRLTVVGAISSLKDETAVPTLISALDDEMFTVRSAALNSLKSYKSPETAELLLSQYPEPYTQNHNPKTLYPEIVIKAISDYLRVTADSISTEYEKKKYIIMNQLEKMAVSKNELVRAEALSTLWKHGGELQKQWVEMKLENEFSPYVKAVFEEEKR
jgi:hypothetical protein